MLRSSDLRLAALVVAVSTATLGYTTRPELGGTPAMWLISTLVHLGLAGVTLWALFREGTIREQVTPHSGDVTRGASVGLGLLLLMSIARAKLAPMGSISQSWILQIYSQLGDPNEVQKSFGLTALVILGAAASEIAWRGTVQPALTERLGNVRGCLVGSVLFGLSALPSVFTLADPFAGPNPLLILVALLGGLSWSFLTLATGRLFPAIFSHAVVAYFSAVDFRVPGL